MHDTAGWVNDAILLGTGILVWRYVRATNSLVRSSQEQVRISQEQVLASQQQVEGQSLPALVIQDLGQDQLNLVNIGNGPALGVEWRFKDRGTVPQFSDPQKPVDGLSYLEARQTKSMSFDLKTLVKWEMHCLYRSISGRRYISISTFTEKATVETEFHEEQKSSHR